MSKQSSSHFENKVQRQRLVSAGENIWRAVQGPLWLLIFTAALVATGALALLSDQLRLAVLAALGLALLLSFRPLLRVRGISRQDALRHMEIAAQLEHRALSSTDDHLSEDLADPQTDAIWQAHQRRLQKIAEQTPVARPRSSWRQFDPRAFRVPVALALVAGLLLGPADFGANFQQTFAVQSKAPVQSVSLDAWLKPPAYTGKPPLLLTSAATAAKLSAGGELLVPENAVLSVRLKGGTAPRLVFEALGDAGTPAKELTDIVSTTQNGADGFVATASLSRPVVVKMFDGTEVLASWPITLIPDVPPTIKLTAEPSQESLGSMVLQWQAEDDYGVKSITTELALSDEQADGPGFSGNGVFLFYAPEFPIALKKARAKTIAATSQMDLTSHPWAGLKIDLIMIVTDEAGKTGTLVKSAITLPERGFIKPLAKALIEQRKVLIMTPERVNEVADLLGAIAAYPEGLVTSSGQVLNLSAAVARLRNYRNHQDLVEAIADLWILALDIEEGNLADARAELQALKKELERAIAEGASPERIAQLMDKMRDAMERYMDAMREEGDKRQRQGDKGQKAPRDAQTLSEQDLQKMLDTIEKLSQNGAKDAAQELLAQLDRMLQNMEPGQSQNQSDQSDQQTSEMLNELSDLMKRQQQLMGETQGKPQQGQGDQSDRGEGQQGRSGERTGEALAGDQQQLRETLDRMMRELGGDAPTALGEAGRRMDEAGRNLKEDEREQAAGEQGKALDELRNGAQKLAKQGRERRGQGQAGNEGRDGEAGGDQLDPLGRPRASRNPDFGPKENMVPSELAIRRAREILEQLRSRANEGGIAKPELDYIERLLRGIY